MSKLLEVKGLHADLRLPAGALHAVRNVSFSMDQGETLSLVGESGCGKSMTALAIMDLLPPRGIRRADTLVFEGRDLMTADASAMAGIRGGRMAMIFQEPMTALNPVIPVGKQIEAIFDETDYVDPLPEEQLGELAGADLVWLDDELIEEEGRYVHLELVALCRAMGAKGY